MLGSRKSSYILCLTFAWTNSIASLSMLRTLSIVCRHTHKRRSFFCRDSRSTVSSHLYSVRSVPMKYWFEFFVRKGKWTIFAPRIIESCSFYSSLSMHVCSKATNGVCLKKVCVCEEPTKIIIIFICHFISFTLVLFGHELPLRATTF